MGRFGKSRKLCLAQFEKHRKVFKLQFTPKTSQFILPHLPSRNHQNWFIKLLNGVKDMHQRHAHHNSESHQRYNLIETLCFKYSKLWLTVEWRWEYSESFKNHVKRKNHCENILILSLRHPVRLWVGLCTFESLNNDQISLVIRSN